MMRREVYKIASTPGFRTEFISQLDYAFGGRRGWCGIDDDGDFYINSSTAGWNSALYKTCARLGHYELWSWYDALPWSDSDEIDGIFEDCLRGIDPFKQEDMV